MELNLHVDELVYMVRGWADGTSTFQASHYPHVYAVDLLCEELPATLGRLEMLRRVRNHTLEHQLDLDELCVALAERYMRKHRIRPPADLSLPSDSLALEWLIKRGPIVRWPVRNFPEGSYSRAYLREIRRSAFDRTRREVPA